MRRLHMTILLLLSCTAALAQELSLSEAIQKGLINNYGIRIEQKRLEVAGNNNSWGEAGRYPTIDISLSQNNNFTDNVKTASPFQPQGLSISNAVIPAVDVNWTLFNGFKVNITKNKLEELEAESEGNAAIVVANTIQAIVLGYYNLQMQQQRLEVMEVNRRLSADKYSYIKVKKQFGTAVTSDLLLEEGNYLTDSVNYINQELQVKQANRTLNFLMGEKVLDRENLLTDELKPIVDSYTYSDLEGKMISENADLKKQYLSQSIIRMERQTRQAERYPTLSLNLNGSSNNGRVDYSNATFPNSNPDDFSEPLTSVTNNYSASFRLTFNLFNGGKINRAIKNALIQEDIAQMQTEELRLSLRDDLRAAFDNYEVKKQLYGINLRKREVTELNLELASEQFKNGTINSFDYRNIQTTYQQAAVEELQALYDLTEAHVNLMRLSGGIVEVYK